MPVSPIAKKPATPPVKPVVKKTAPVKPPVKPVVAKDELKLSFTPKLTRAEQLAAEEAAAAAKIAVEPPAMSASAAVAMALAGNAVRLAPADPEAPRWVARPDLAIKETPAQDGRRAFAVELAGTTFDVVAPPAGDAAETLARMVAIVAEVPEDVRATVRRIDVRQGHEAGAAYTVSLDGGEVIDVARTALLDGRATYTVSDPHGKFELTTTEDARDGWEVAQAFHLWAMIPPAMRSALKTIRVEDGANPTDAEFAVKYNTPDFVSAASAANGLASFWHGTKYLQADIFLHEFGHVLGQTYSTTSDLAPDGWRDAIQADARTVTKYGDNNPTEDFAEAFWVYVTLLRGRPVHLEDAPKDLQAYRDRWPARAAMLDKMFAGEIRPATK